MRPVDKLLKAFKDVGACIEKYCGREQTAFGLAIADDRNKHLSRLMALKETMGSNAHRAKAQQLKEMHFKEVSKHKESKVFDDCVMQATHCKQQMEKILKRVIQFLKEEDSTKNSKDVLLLEGLLKEQNVYAMHETLKVILLRRLMAKNSKIIVT